MPIVGKHHVHPYSNAILGSTSTARLFQEYFAAKILVSRFVAGIRHSNRMLRSLCKNERQLMSQKETLLRSAAAVRATRAQQPERSAALLSYRSGRREPQRSVEGVRTA